MVELSEDDYVTTHSPVLALDLVPHRRPNMNPKPGGHLECNVSSYRLRRVAVARLDENPARQAEIADVLLTVHQCERHTLGTGPTCC